MKEFPSLYSYARSGVNFWLILRSYAADPKLIMISIT